MVFVFVLKSWRFAVSQADGERGSCTQSPSSSRARASDSPHVFSAFCAVHHYNKLPDDFPVFCFFVTVYELEVDGIAGRRREGPLYTVSQ